MLTRILVAAATLIAALCVGASPAEAAWSQPGHRAVVERVSADPTIVEVAGDSTTAQPDSWRAQLAEDFAFTGYAHDGYTSTQVRTHFKPAPADVLVIRLGTNDMRLNHTIRGVLQNDRAIAAASGVSNVILVATAPSDLTRYGTAHINRRARGALLNQELQQLAANHGWTYIDPDVAVRLPNNGYAKGTTVEGVHPTAATYALEAAILAPAIVQMTATL